jgi:hypothetical protein
MASAGETYLLGLATGLALATTASYRRVSPPWLRWLLMLSGAFVMSRYTLRAPWILGAVGLTLPAFFAIDQLLKHPAMTPMKLLRWYTPFAALYGLVLLWPEPAVVPRLSAVVTGLFSTVLVTVGLLVLRQLPAGAVRTALLLLIAAYLGFAIDTIFTASRLGVAYSELLVLLALWHAFETSARLQQSP